MEGACRSDENDAGATGSAQFVSGRSKWIMLVSMTAVFLVLLALYCGVLSVLLPNQIEMIDHANKARDLAIVFAITSIFSTLTTPIAGALSDRTRTRFGRRAPWIFAGSVVGALCLAAVSQMTALWTITLFWVGATVALNSMQAAITTVVADRFEESERGVASGFVGAGMTSGCTIGIVVAGLAAPHFTVAYIGFGLVVAIACTTFVVINPEPKIAHSPAPPFKPLAFLSNFWVSPRKHPDFAWAFLGRFTIYMGYQAIVTYLLYILQDYIHLSIEQSNRTIATLSSITFVALIISALSSGYISDRIGRRKPLVFASSIIMGSALLVALLVPSLRGMMGYAALIGLGYGAFMSVDMALMTQVLPKTGGGSTGKDLGLLTTAINVPQILSPVLAAWLLGVFGNDYRVLFIAAMAFVFAGSFCVLPIRSVK
jgi:MFS family permease